MESSTTNLLSNYMPMVQRYRSQFASFNTLLGKTTLTGKISSLEIAENLFDYMEKTQEKFENLQEKLIETILEQNFLNSYEEADTSVKIISEIFNLYFHNRHEDISTLSKSKFLIDLCLEFESNKDKDKEKSKSALDSIVAYLKKFGSSSAVYKDIMLYTNDGTLLQAIDLGQDYAVAYKTKLNPILEAGKIENYGEFHQKVDFYNTKEREQEDKTEFFFVVPLRQSKEQVPSMVAVFVMNVQSEFKAILERFPYRLPQSNLVVINAKNHILFSDNARMFPSGQLLSLNEHKDYTFLEYRSKVCMVALRKIGNIHGFTSITEQWRLCRIVPLYIAFDAKKQIDYKIDPSLLENSLLITKDLDIVIEESENINDELGDVVINGEIIASKSHSYALNPILNNIRILSEEMNLLCVQSTEELQRGIYNALFNVIGYYSQYSALITDSLFRECVKDSSWIKNEIEFKDYLREHAQGNISSETLTNTKALLARLKANFSNFYNIVLFDKDGNTLQNALDSIPLNAKKLGIVDRFNGSNIENLIVSNYEPTAFYEDKKTILFYNAVKGDDNRFLGGLLYVLDLEKIKDFLSNSLPKDSAILSDKSEIFSVAFDSQKNILATTKEDFSFESYNLSEKFDFKTLKSFKKIIQIGNEHYLICSEVCNPTQSTFTEYTKRSLYVMIFVAVKREEVEEYLQEAAIETSKDSTKDSNS
ncbi:cache domain-containing protein [Helicobacter sp. MIT 05-5294]|uniref:cache domain-containing protein n=1 Tax=Helicobacter sp. MIT 05-5294 TaxID=1548150 RepID=UPI000AB66E1C|nr:cache domain-containing protein [Helicobacter sp. MIT 05-5294]